MNDSSCEMWRGDIALDALGRLDELQSRELANHVATCPECSKALDELTDTARVLSYVDPHESRSVPVLPDGFRELVLADLSRSAREEAKVRIGHPRWIAVGGLVAASLVVLVVLGFSALSSKPEQRVESLVGSSQVTATATLTAQDWGTSVVLHESGLPGGELYTVSMSTDSGSWWDAGSYRSINGGAVNATMTCGVSIHDIKGLRVTNSQGDVVLSTYTY